MALDIPAEIDLSLIFERDDVRDAFDHVCPRAPHRDMDCLPCMRLRAVLAMAIVEWREIVDIDRVSRISERVRLALRDLESLRATAMSESYDKSQRLGWRNTQNGAWVAYANAISRLQSALDDHS